MFSGANRNSVGAKTAGPYAPFEADHKRLWKAKMQLVFDEAVWERAEGKRPSKPTKSAGKKCI